MIRCTTLVMMGMLCLGVSSYTTDPCSGECAATTPGEPYCYDCRNGDVVLVIDQNDSLGQCVYDTSLDFISAIFLNSTTLPQYMCDNSKKNKVNWRIAPGFVFFNENTTTMALCDAQLSTPNQFNEYVKKQKVKMVQGKSNICKALQKVEDLFQQEETNDRPRTVILFSNGLNTVDSCNSTQVEQQAAKLANIANTEIIVVIEHQLDNDQTSNLEYLSVIASKDENGVPLIFNLTVSNSAKLDQTSIEAIQNRIDDNYGCCECYVDIALTVQIDDENVNASTLQPFFTELLNYTAEMGFDDSNSKIEVSLVTFSSSKNTYIRAGPSRMNVADKPPGYGSCNAGSSDNQGNTCLREVIGDPSYGCPVALTNSSTFACYWFSGDYDLTRGLILTSDSVGRIEEPQGNYDRPEAPNINVLFATGDCNDGYNSADCVKLREASKDYQPFFPLILAVNSDLTGYHSNAITDLKRVTGYLDGRSYIIGFQHQITGYQLSQITKMKMSAWSNKCKFNL